jgi:hypothetical protein
MVMPIANLVYVPVVHCYGKKHYGRATVHTSLNATYLQFMSAFIRQMIFSGPCIWPEMRERFE